MIMNISHIARKIWFPTVVGWVAFALLIAWLYMDDLINADIDQPSVIYMLVFWGLLLVCVAGQGICMLWSLCALYRRPGMPPRENRREVILAACLSWGWLVAVSMLFQ